MNIKWENYRIFYHVSIEKSFSKAAKKLYLTQSALSQTIKQLETELDTPLFLRHKKGVDLTKEGELLFQKIRIAYDFIDIGEKELFSISQLNSGELNIGAGDTFCKYYLIRYLSQFKENYPDIHLKVMNGTTPELVQMLKERKIDVAFINMPYNDEHIEIKPYLNIHDIFVSSKKENKIYSLKDISHQNLILLEKQSNSRLFIDEFFQKHHYTLHPIYELGAHDLLLTFAKAGMGISCVIKEFSLEEIHSNTLYELKLEKSLPERSIGYAYLKNRTLNNACQKFIELLYKK